MLSAAALLAAGVLGGCDDDDGGDIVDPPQPGAATINTDITASRTLRRDTTYTLSGFI